MNNQVAAPCCGSCEQFRWSDGKGVYICLDPEVEKQDVSYLVGTHSLPPLPDCYIPRNPIPLLKLPGVKELVEKAWMCGCDRGMDWGTPSHYKRALAKYMKALEAK